MITSDVECACHHFMVLLLYQHPSQHRDFTFSYSFRYVVQKFQMITQPNMPHEYIFFKKIKPMTDEQIYSVKNQWCFTQVLIKPLSDVYR